MMERLFVYGTLQPGGSNEHILAAIAGEWELAVIKGHLTQAGWGATMGYPGLTVDENGDEIKGYVFSSINLSNQWDHLDAFEGEEYERIQTSVTLLSGERVQAHVYALRS